jgi:hypothetical protein
MTTYSVSYPSGGTLSCTLASLASSTTVGRSSTPIDNTSNLYEDASVEVKLRTNGSTPTGDKASYIWLAASADGTNYGGSSAEAVGSDAAVTFDAPTNLFGPFILSMPTASTTYRLIIPSVASVFGFMPKKVCVITNNQTGNALDSTAGNHSITWTGFQRTST